MKIDVPCKLHNVTYMMASYDNQFLIQWFKYSVKFLPEPIFFSDQMSLYDGLIKFIKIKS